MGFFFVFQMIMFYLPKRTRIEFCLHIQVAPLAMRRKELDGSSVSGRLGAFTVWGKAIRNRVCFVA